MYLRTRYNEYLLHSGLNNYLLLCHSNFIAAKAQYHPVGVKQFAVRFFSHSVVISQDDKAKISLGISAVRKTFKIRTHTSYHLAYNPVEYGMATLSQKLVEIGLSIDKNSTYFNFQSEVINQELAKKIF
ncbi:20082_t:CDS:2, partial [Cetraspora pellucida]